MKTKQAGNLIQKFTITIWLIAFALAFWNFKRFGSLMYLGMIMMLGTMPLALSYGRVYCGWLCPMGGLLDNLLPRLSRNRPSPPWLRHPSVRIASLIFFGGLGVFFWNRFPEGLSLNWRGVVLGPVLLVMMTMMATALTLGLLYRRRAFCAHLCPTGFIGALLSRSSHHDLYRQDACLDCGKCERVCVLEDKTWADGKRAGAECIRCLECAFACPVQAIAYESKATVPAGRTASNCP
ncbi:MAG: 4Fe-4S binding protein [Firmicutes bacterium]|nr:4Fe-4S binding protein [Bacillota bacterium]